MKHLLTEDDCAPDALEIFEKEFKEITKMSLEEFREKAIEEKSKDGYVISYELGKYFLWFSADHPFWTLETE